MAPESDPAPDEAHPLALREGGDRRQMERRAQPRVGPDRRRSQRRRQWFGHVLLTSLTFGVPAPTNIPKWRPPSQVSKNAPKEASALAPPRSAVDLPEGPYVELIVEAAIAYDLDPRLIHTVVAVESDVRRRRVGAASAILLGLWVAALLAAVLVVRFLGF